MNSGISSRTRNLIVAASLLALFLGALDALIMSAAMPTIVADLGAIHLYSWVYSTYFLARAVSLPIFGKLADLYQNKTLFLISTALFLLASVAAGCSPNMPFLIAARIFQGIGAGGNFALVYIILSDVSAPEKRGKMLSLASSIWGISSVLGPSLGGFIVSYFSWRWIFFINVPIGLLSLAGIAFFLVELRPQKSEIHLDLAGAFLLLVGVVAFLMVFMTGGSHFPWLSPEIIAFALVSLAAVFGFYLTEKRARDPILDFRFFRLKGFRIGNFAPFLSSFAIFSLFAYAPMFMQGGLGMNPMEVGAGMLTLSLGWSASALVLGQVIHRMQKRTSARIGSLFLLSGCGLTLFFSQTTTMTECIVSFTLVGIGMGLVTLSTLLVVQESLDISDLGVATSSNQFARTLGGAVGIGISGGFVTRALTYELDPGSRTGVLAGLPEEILESLKQNIETLFQPEVQSMLPAPARQALGEAVANGVSSVFWIVFLVSLLCVWLCFLIPKSGRGQDTRPRD
ncbi:MAG: MFS transporter [Desulfohalobiaceae bacterium]|nr:MFS transporter [Desulfohalobiaceae bacterium]